MMKYIMKKDDAKDFFTAKVLKDCEDKVQEENIKMLYLVNLALFVFSFSLYLFSVVFDYIHPLKSVYSVFLLVSIFGYLWIHRVVEKKRFLIVPTIVGDYVVISGYLIYNNIMLHTETAATSIYIFMGLAFCFLIKPMALIGLQIISAIFFFSLSLMIKTLDMALLDGVNLLMMLLMSWVLGCTILKFRMNSMEKLEQKDQALLVSNLYQNILDETQTGVVVHDIDAGEIIYGNHRIKEIYNIHGEVPEEKHSSRIYLERGKWQEKTDMEALREGAVSESVEYHKESGRYYEVRGKLIDWYGRDAYVEYLFDVTDSRRFSEQLQIAHDEIQRKYQEEMLYRENTVSDDIIASSRMNLTKGYIEALRVGKDDGYENEFRYALALDERVKSYANRIWIDEEQLRRMTPEKLLESYQKGQHRLSERFVAELKNGRHVWIRVEVSIVERPETSEIIAFAYSRNITKEKMLTTILEKIMSFEYDEIYTIDSINGHISAVAKGHFALSSQLKEGDYNQELELLKTRTVSESDKTYLERKLNLKYICRKLEKHASYVIEIPLISKNGRNRLKQLRFLSLNEKIGTLLFTLKDIEEVVKEEKDKQEKLEVALQIAEEASATKTHFLANMSHEIRTPMNAIIGLTSIIKEDPENVKQVLDSTDKLETASKYLLSLLNDILDMSRIESGNVVLQHQRFEAKNFWESVNILANTQAGPAGINYVFEAKNWVSGEFIGDATRLQQIVINLINNAIKFTPFGGSVSVVAEEHENISGRSRLSITVTDTGIGISKDFLPNVFKAFAQEHDGNTSSYGGSGLGLSIARNYARMMDGDITVKSTIGIGTTFIVEVWIDKVGVVKQVVKMEEKEGGGDHSFKGKKILLVEDHPLNTMVATRLLEKKEAIVVHAENGQKALDAFRDSNENEFAAILMDIRMPIMDGIEATKCIRRLERGDAKSIPIIAMTANAYDEDRQKTKNAGMNEHLAKPIEPQLLYETLGSFL